MILKIERYTHDASTNNWWMLDDIRKVSKTLIKEVPFKNNENDELFDIVIFDFHQHLKDNKMDQQNRDLIQLICRLSNGNEFCMLFDTIAYILNDNGKTIEKLVANHR